MTEKLIYQDAHIYIYQFPLKVKLWQKSITQRSMSKPRVALSARKSTMNTARDTSITLLQGSAGYEERSFGRSARNACVITEGASNMCNDCVDTALCPCSCVTLASIPNNRYPNITAKELIFCIQCGCAHIPDELKWKGKEQ